MALDRNYIGSYRLLKLVRAGASCQIWEVISERDNRRCALKTLQEEFRKDRDEVALLKHEYTVGSTLQHPNVIEIYEFDVSKGIPFLALEYFESNNLKQWIREYREAPAILAHLPKVIKQAAEGLNYLHDQGWIHRDVKPDNFLVNEQFHVKLIDFAIAQRMKRGFARFLGGRSKIQGTRSYMSPEQIRGESLDARSDVYSFGCMLFELFSGRPPFTGGNPDELLQKHLRAPIPSLLASQNAISPDFSTLVGRMMSKDPNERPPSIQAFIDEMSGIRMLRVRKR